MQLSWGTSNTATNYDIIRDGVTISTGVTQLSFKNNGTNLAGQSHNYVIRAHNPSATSIDSNTVTVSVPSTICQVPLVANGIAGNYSGTGQKTIFLSGSGLSSITKISWNCTMPNGISICPGSPFVWTPGTARWENITITNDTVATVYPTFLEATDPGGTYNWTVTFSGGGQQVTSRFTVTK